MPPVFAHSWLHTPVKAAVNLCTTGYAWLALLHARTIKRQSRASERFLLDECRMRMAAVHRFISELLMVSDQLDSSWVKQPPTPTDQEFLAAVQRATTSRQLIELYCGRVEHGLCIGENGEYGSGIVDFHTHQRFIAAAMLSLWDVAGVLWSLLGKFSAGKTFACEITCSDPQSAGDLIRRLRCLKSFNEIDAKNSSVVRVLAIDLDSLLLFLREIRGGSAVIDPFLANDRQNIIRKVTIIDDNQEMCAIGQQLDQCGWLDCQDFYYASATEHADYLKDFQNALRVCEEFVLPMCLTPKVLRQFGEAMKWRDTHYDVNPVDFMSLWLNENTEFRKNLYQFIGADKTLCAALIGCPLPLVKWVSWFDTVIGIPSGHADGAYMNEFGWSDDLYDFLRFLSSYWLHAFGNQNHAKEWPTDDDCAVRIGNRSIEDQIIDINENAINSKEEFQQLVQSATKELGFTTDQAQNQMFHGCNAVQYQKFENSDIYRKPYDYCTDFQPRSATQMQFHQLYLGDSIWMAVAWAIRQAVPRGPPQSISTGAGTIQPATPASFHGAVFCFKCDPGLMYCRSDPSLIVEELSNNKALKIIRQNRHPQYSSETPLFDGVDLVYGGVGRDGMRAHWVLDKRFKQLMVNSDRGLEHVRHTLEGVLKITVSGNIGTYARAIAQLAQILQH